MPSLKFPGNRSVRTGFRYAWDTNDTQQRITGDGSDYQYNFIREKSGQGGAITGRGMKVYR